MLLWTGLGWLVAAVGILNLFLLLGLDGIGLSTGNKPLTETLKPIMTFATSLLLFVIGWVLNNPAKLRPDDVTTKRYCPVSFSAHTFWFFKIEVYGLLGIIG